MPPPIAPRSPASPPPRPHHPHASRRSSPQVGIGKLSFDAAVHGKNQNDSPERISSFLTDPLNVGGMSASSTGTFQMNPPVKTVKDAASPATESAVNSNPTQTLRMRNFPQASRRSFTARSMTMTDAALAAIAFDNESDEESYDGIECIKEAKPKFISLICTICYNGMDVVFATTAKHTILAICARTRVTFQYLDVPTHPDVSIVSLVGNSITGIVLATLSNGDIYTYIPREAPVLGGVFSHHHQNHETHLPSHHNGHGTTFHHHSPTTANHNNQKLPETVAAFGRYRWCSEQVIHCARIFEAGAQHIDIDYKKITFARKRNRKEGEKVQEGPTIEEDNDLDDEDDDSKNYVHVSCCRMNKVLVAYRDQMAVFNVCVSPNLHSGAAAQILTEAELLWITQLHKHILHARLSGDGNAIAVVVQGEGEGVPFPFGVRTFLRDKEDGTFVRRNPRKKQRSADGRASSLFPMSQQATDSNIIAAEKDITISRKHRNPSLAIGVVYKPGPFLKHSRPVTRISWRGGSSAHSTDDSIITDGNDLLLTHCKDDSSTRIFSQGGMDELLQWNTPPGSRADWIYGISAANLGDLDTNKKDKDAADEEGMWYDDSKMSRVGSSGFLNAMDEAGGAGAPGSQVLPHHPVPSTSAGAWIAELTFRGAYPALRLSRLSYVKSGGDNFQAAHFESVAAILPAGALNSKAVLEGEEESFSVQGFWPVWNPWSRGSTTGIGGSHSPPSELRIVASHSVEDRAVLLEFPLWGDKDFGATEFGAPLKYVLSLSDFNLQEESRTEYECESNSKKSRPVCLEVESSRLVAQIAPDKQSVNLTWHREGSMSVLSSPSNADLISSFSALSLAQTPSTETLSLKKYIDISVTPVPLALPSVRNQNNQGDITHLHWWPDGNFGGPPRLLVLNSNGTLILFEMPPPWSALEPPMPISFGDGAKSVVSENETYDFADLDALESLDDQNLLRQEYEVLIRPHPDFGIGLRLEAQADGLPAIAGSYKKHPLNGGRLPAEKTGMIILGDELLAVNNESLEGLSFDDIINVVRKVGAESNGELLMKFRSGRERERILQEGLDPEPSLKRGHLSSATLGSDCDAVSVQSCRRSIMNLSRSKNNLIEKDDFDEECSIATVMVGAEGEIQQEFCRIVAMANCALPGNITAMVLLPWHYGIGAPNPVEIRGAALIVTCSGRKLTASRLEVTNDLNPEHSRHFIIGSVDLEVTNGDKELSIESLTVVKTATEGWCLAACDNEGKVTLVFIYVQEDKTLDQPFSASFRQCPIFQCNDQSRGTHKFSSYLLRAYSVQLLATMPNTEACSKVTVWLALPRSHVSSSEENPTDYRPITVSIDPKDTILDFIWLPSGSLDAFPWLVTFSSKSVIVHQRPGSELGWIAVAELKYPSVMGSSPHLNRNHFAANDYHSSYEGTLSPADAYPHLIPALRNMIESCDEHKHVRADWHPDSILAFICTESKGANKALKQNVQGLFTWLSQWMSPDSTARPQWNANFNLEIAPLRVVQDDSIFEEDEEKEEEVVVKVETAASLFSNLSVNPQQKESEQKQAHLPTEAEMLIFELQTSLLAHQKKLEKQRLENSVKGPKRSNEFILAMSQSSGKNDEEKNVESGEIPSPLKNLNEDEILFLWGMGKVIAKPPKFSKLDPPSQLTLFSLTLLRTLETYSENDPKSTTVKSYRRLESFATSAESGLVYPSGIASGACLSALLSNTQSGLLSSSRLPGMKMDWATARALRLPFWLRDDEELCTIAEEMGQHIFQTTKDVMECALFYIAMRKTLKLQTMARADSRDSGRKLSKFLSSFDFSSERGRKAAEKNAYSLLRKRQYGVAAAFFLLAEPPMLKTALEVIVMQMEDLTLGFFIARLVDHTTKNNTNGGGNLGGGLSLRASAFNGFGGFGGVIGSSPQKEESFEKWTPHLGPAGKSLLEQRGLVMSKDDPCFKAVLLIWLNKPIQAARCLSGSTENSKGDEHYNIDVIVPPSFDTSLLHNTKSAIVPCLSPPLNYSTLSFERVIIKSNMIISFCSAPFLLKTMKSDKRLLWSSALHVSRALSRRGLELSSVQTLLQYTDSSDLEEKKDETVESSTATDVQKPKPVQSSIFDSFDPPPQKPKPVQSSIFDSFDPPPQKLKSVDPQHTSLSSKESPSPLHEDNDTKDISLPLPPLWLEWREHLLALAVARRLIREMARVVAKFHGDTNVAPMHVLERQDFPLAPAAATEVFQNHCEGDVLIKSVQECLDELCSNCHLEAAAVVEQALLLLGCPGLPRRIIFAVLLHMLMNRPDLAEDVVRDAAQSQMQRCESFAFANDDLVNKRKTTFHMSSFFVRRKAARVSWQLELCLWLHRGGLLPMSGIAVKETIIAVRIGFIIASWGNCHETLESLIKCNPDCAQDHEQGRQLWTSMKVMNDMTDNARKGNGSGSGGWEFLVDCRRDEATNLLRERKPGSFLLRPHPEDHGVFTLSFKTNLMPSIEPEKSSEKDEDDNKSNTRPVSPDDVVQHAIIRLSDSGFRCGSFGPFPSLIKLLEEVSSSLPFRLLFDEPPAQGIIKEQGGQPSPNSFLLRKLALHAKTEQVMLLKNLRDDNESDSYSPKKFESSEDSDGNIHEEVKIEIRDDKEFSLNKRFGLFSQLLVLSELRKQLSAIAAADFEELPVAVSTWHHEEAVVPNEGQSFSTAVVVDNTQLEISQEDDYSFVEEDMHGVASRMLRPFLQWCHIVEALLVPELAPPQTEIANMTVSPPIDVDISETGIEAGYLGSSLNGGDAVIRSMIQPGSGVEFRTLRVGEGSSSAIVVLFSKSEAISWLISNGSEKTQNEAAERLKIMEKNRVIEEININLISTNNQSKPFPLGTTAGNHGLKDETLYRFVDPWEVETLDSKEAEGKGATLGRERLLSFNLISVARCTEQIKRNLGGVRLLSLWSTAKGGIFLTKAIASVHPPWDRDVGADLQVSNGSVVEPSPYLLSLKKRLYRNAIFRRLQVPQRFVSLVQVELLDLKNLTAPGGSPPLNAFALLRLKRPGSSAPLNLKARTIDSAITRPKRISKSSGPNAPASWGTLVRFRFTLPEDVTCDCISYDSDTEALFKGPPSVLQLSVYEKKFMSDLLLGGANIKLDGLSSGGQLEEWVPLSSNKEVINWFARIRITLRFELMCLDIEEPTQTDGVKVEFEVDDNCPSVALKKIKKLSREGGAHEVSKGVKKSKSASDFKSYFENMAAF